MNDRFAKVCGIVKLIGRVRAKLIRYGCFRTTVVRQGRKIKECFLAQQSDCALAYVKPRLLRLVVNRTYIEPLEYARLAKHLLLA